MTDDLLAQIEAVAQSGYEPVTVGDLTIPLRKLSMAEVIRVVRRFPKMREVVFGVVGKVIDKAMKGDKDIGAEDLMPPPATLMSVFVDEGPEAPAAFVAAAAGKAGDARYEAALAALPDDGVIALAVHVKEKTAPEGIVPFFVDLVERLATEQTVAAKPSSGKPATAKRIRKA